MGRTGWLAAMLLVGVSLRAVALSWTPPHESSLPCDARDVRQVSGPEGRFAACAARGEPLPAAWAVTLGQKLDLNGLKEEELARVQGVGPKLATALVKARAKRGRFRDWDEVDAVPGVGPAKLETLQTVAEIRP